MQGQQATTGARGPGQVERRLVGTAAAAKGACRVGDTIAPPRLLPAPHHCQGALGAPRGPGAPPRPPSRLACSCTPNQRVTAPAVTTRAGRKQRRRRAAGTNWPQCHFAGAVRAALVSVAAKRWDMYQGIKSPRRGARCDSLSTPPTNACSAHEPDAKCREGGTCTRF